MPWLWVHPEYSIHRVQHTPSTAPTQDCLSSPHSDDYTSTPECSFSFWRSSLHNRLPSASSPWALECKVTLSHSNGCKLTNWWIKSLHPAHGSSTTSKYSFNLAPLWPPSVSPNLLDYGLQVNLQTRSTMTCKFTQSWPPSASSKLLGHDLGVYH